MKMYRVEELQGNETVARPVMTLDYTVLLSKGTVLKKEYIEKLKVLGINEVYVEDTSLDVETIGILKQDIKEHCKETVKSVLERHTYHQNKKLEELSITADDIISNILEEPKVVERIYDIKERSADIYEHSINVCTLATMVSLRLAIEKQKIHDIGVGCLLHDIGLRYLTIEYTDKNEEQLGKAEKTEYRKHPIYGFSSLQQENWLSDVSKNIILYHHERIDGSGFPLKTKDIPIEAKIVGTCDAFDEMICGIGYERIKVHEAIECLKNLKNTKFDGNIVNILLEFTAVYPAGTTVMTNENEQAVVIRQNSQFTDRPVLRIIKNRHGEAVKVDLIKDLLENENLYIVKVIN